MPPKVSVLMSAFNAAEFLGEAIQSILNQSLDDFELLVYDDASTDNTALVVESFDDPRIRIFKNDQNLGLTSNLIDGMRRAEGSYLARLDADDIAQPDRLAKQARFLEENPEVSLVGSAVKFFDGLGYEFLAMQPETHEEIACVLLLDYTMLHPTVMFRLADFRDHGLEYDPSFVVSQDHDLWLRASKRLRFASLPEALVDIRIHENQIGKRQNSRQVELSSKARRARARDLGLELTNQQVGLIAAGEDEVAAWTATEILQYESLLLALVEANRSAAQFDQSTLERVVARYFRERCRIMLIHGRGNGLRYWVSRVRRYDEPSIRQLLGLVFRSIEPLSSKVRQLLSRFFLQDWIEVGFGFKDMLALAMASPSSPSVLVVELNPFHGEILPGYCEYFRRLGFEVHLVHRRANAIADPFVRVPDEWKPKQFVLTPWQLKLLMARDLFKQYSIGFVTSVMYVQKFGFFGSVAEYLGRVPEGAHGCLAVEHSFRGEVSAWTVSLAEQGRLFLLTADEREGLPVPMLNPHYFGSIVKEKSRTGPIRFITVGAFLEQNRRFEDLLDGLASLNHESDRDFELVVVGRETERLRDLPDNVRVSGFLPFSELFDLLEASHYFLPLLDPGNEGHRRYLKGETTGSRQLILGFSLVPIISREFGEHYGFDEDCAYFYSANQVVAAMKDALASSDIEYQAKILSVNELQKSVEDESTGNLAHLLQSLGVAIELETDS